MVFIEGLFNIIDTMPVFGAKITVLFECFGMGCYSQEK